VKRDGYIEGARARDHWVKLRQLPHPSPSHQHSQQRFLSFWDAYTLRTECDWTLWWIERYLSPEFLDAMPSTTDDFDDNK
jgi:hypothetical protein